jgi:GNAT superfamily N-acetyltransferase
MATKSSEKTGAKGAKPRSAATTKPKKAAPAKRATKPPAAKPAKKKPVSVKPVATKAAATRATDASHPLRNPGFPSTYIKEIVVSLDDPDHWVTLKWTGPDAASQEKGPFRSSPGAGNKGVNCDLGPTSRRSGSHCTPKGTRTVEGFARRLNSDSRAEYVTWFHRGRGIAFHYFPSVPKYAASHGCVRLESKRTARLIQDNSRVDRTSVTVGGTWTKPPKQW